MTDIIRKRRSIREFSSQDIPQDRINILLDAAMRGPSCVNSQDWVFIVVKNKETINQMAESNGKSAQPLKKANTAVLVCADFSKSYKGAKDYWIIDCSIACQNLILAATELGIGSLWLGTYPQKEKVNGIQKIFSLPDDIIPHSIIALGYPLDEKEMELGSRSQFDSTKVHYEKW
ncbi:MAG: nitroreductase family protein [Bacilli bacterium]